MLRYVLRIYKVSKKEIVNFSNKFFTFMSTFQLNRVTRVKWRSCISFRIEWNRRISNICILQEIVNDLRTVSTTFTSILVRSGADVASGFACTDISLWFPIFSVTLLLSNITFAHLLLSRQGLEENFSLVKKNLWTSVNY